jgi:hypothetical protein
MQGLSLRGCVGFGVMRMLEVDQLVGTAITQQLDIGEVVRRRSPSQDERAKALAFSESEENSGQK